MKRPHSLDYGIATAQLILSLIIIVGFFGMIVARSIGWLSMDFDIKEIVMVVVTFWFMRNRPPSGAEPGATSDATPAQDAPAKRARATMPTLTQ